MIMDNENENTQAVEVEEETNTVPFPVSEQSQDLPEEEFPAPTGNPPREDYDRTREFEEEVAPLTQALARKCNDLGIPVVINFTTSAKASGEGSSYQTRSLVRLKDTPGPDDREEVRLLPGDALDRYPHQMILALAAAKGIPTPKAVKENLELVRAALVTILIGAEQAGEEDLVHETLLPLVIKRIAEGPLGEMFAKESGEDGKTESPDAS